MKKEQMTGSCERIAAAIAGQCTTCGWYAGCLCGLCIEHGDIVRYRCPVCFNAFSQRHDRNYTQGLEGTRDGTAYNHEHYGKAMKKEV